MFSQWTIMTPYTVIRTQPEMCRLRMYPPADTDLQLFFSIRGYLLSDAQKLKSRNNLDVKLAHGMPVQTFSAHQPWLSDTRSQNTAAWCGRDPATLVSLILSFIILCAWFQSTCIPCRSHGFPSLPVWHPLYATKQQLTRCFRSSKPIQTDPCMLMSLGTRSGDRYYGDGVGMGTGTVGWFGMERNYCPCAALCVICLHKMLPEYLSILLFNLLVTGQIGVDKVWVICCHFEFRYPSLLTLTV